MGIPHAPKPLQELDEAGGAYVRRAFGKYAAGDRLTTDEVKAIPRPNLLALVNTGRLELWPAAPEGTFIAERFAFCRFGKWTVIEGRCLTPEPVTKEEAEALVAAG